VRLKNEVGLAREPEAIALEVREHGLRVRRTGEGRIRGRVLSVGGDCGGSSIGLLSRREWGAKCGQHAKQKRVKPGRAKWAHVRLRAATGGSVARTGGLDHVRNDFHFHNYPLKGIADQPT
jgi:hypothetical protein